jgi:O-acetyl-ADP-ribose deacetylase (regulator of RNase III)
MIKYISGGNIVNPVGGGKIGESNKIIIHCCNDIGAMGAGVAKVLYEKWGEVREEYINWFRDYHPKLGDAYCVSVGDRIVVANMIGQHGIGSDNGKPPIRYDAIEKSMNEVKRIAVIHKASIHVPYLMGCDLAGGDWDKIEEIIDRVFVSNGVSVYVYDFFKKYNGGKS